MIDFISAESGMIELFHEDGRLVGVSNNPLVLASKIMEHGGPAPVIRGSSSCDFAEEYGFETQADFDYLWKQTCELL